MQTNANDMLLRDLNDDGILRLTLSDAGRRNALSEAMLATLAVAFAEAGADPSVRVVILAANGQALCAGHDLKGLVSNLCGGPDGSDAIARRKTAA